MLTNMDVLLILSAITGTAFVHAVSEISEQIQRLKLLQYYLRDGWLFCDRTLAAVLLERSVL